MDTRARAFVLGFFQFGAGVLALNVAALLASEIPSSSGAARRALVALSLFMGAQSAVMFTLAAAHVRSRRPSAPSAGSTLAYLLTSLAILFLLSIAASVPAWATISLCVFLVAEVVVMVRVVRAASVAHADSAPPGGDSNERLA